MRQLEQLGHKVEFEPAAPPKPRVAGIFVSPGAVQTVLRQWDGTSVDLALIAEIYAGVTSAF